MEQWQSVTYLQSHVVYDVILTSHGDIIRRATSSFPFDAAALLTGCDANGTFRGNKTGGSSMWMEGSFQTTAEKGSQHAS